MHTEHVATTLSDAAIFLRRKPTHHVERAPVSSRYLKLPHQKATDELFFCKGKISQMRTPAWLQETLEEPLQGHMTD